MNLIIDVGNSFIKLAVYSKNKLKFKEVVEINVFLKHVISIKSEYNKLANAIISSVGRLNQEDVKVIKKLFNLLVLDSNTKLPFTNLYKTPKTLGVDRIALIGASISQYPKKNVLVIDAGTCITYDFINSHCEYLGGAISPGLLMRYRSLNNLTANLPLLDLEIPNTITGNSTEESIHSGVVNGVLFEIDGAIQKYKLKYPDLTIILTGGDANFLSKQLKSSIFANSNFLLEGLNFILQFNTNS